MLWYNVSQTQKTLRKVLMTTIAIDNVEYDVDLLPDNAKAQIASIQFVDAELARLSAQAAALQTARAAYAAGLKQHLDTFSGDTIKFN